MKVVKTTCKRETGRTKPVNEMKTTTKSSFQNFHRQLPLRSQETLATIII